MLIFLSSGEKYRPMRDKPINTLSDTGSIKTPYLLFPYNLDKYPSKKSLKAPKIKITRESEK
jgi:hypothetical protein